MAERSDLERKEIVDLRNAEHRLKLVREVVAMMNAGGGSIHIGVANDGREVGLEPVIADRLDPASVGDLIEGFIAPDRAEIAVSARELPTGRVIVELSVPAAMSPPVVVCRTGNYLAEDGKQKECFAAHSVFVRRNTKAEPARWHDFRRWRDEAVDRARNEMVARLTMVAEAPAGARIRVLADDEVRDEPSFFLSRAAEVFRQRSNQLLTASDLQYLWRHRASLRLDDAAEELVFHSALRRRATLWLWMASLNLSPHRVADLLRRSLALRDRDKSDAARSILQVAAAFLDDAGYEDVRTAVAASEYAHMRDAAKQLSDKQSALASLGDGDGARITHPSMDQLVERIGEVLEESETVVSRRLPPLAWEYFSRRRSG